MNACNPARLPRTAEFGRIQIKAGRCTARVRRSLRRALALGGPTQRARAVHTSALTSRGRFKLNHYACGGLLG